MMEQEKLRKADIFSGSLILLLGLFIISQALKMPMKDSWGGVQNVWYVSPALFPLLVGGMLVLLGIVLITIAFKSVGMRGLQEVFGFLFGPRLPRFLKDVQVVRFYAIVFNLIVFVFLLVPHVDFFLAALFFLLVAFFMFYCGDYSQLLKIFAAAACCTVLLLLFFLLGLDERLTPITEFAIDWLVILLIFALCLVARRSTQGHAEQKKKFRRSLIIAVFAPLIIGIIFKYFLLVPMPHEGLIVQLLDSIWYADLWS